MIDSLVKVLEYADFDKSIRVIVLTGAGKSFCAGGDLKAMEEKSGMFQGESNELRMRYIHGILKIPKCIEDLSTPLIGLINGPAVGAGCDLAMMCDLRIGSKRSLFLESFTRLGLVPGDGGTFFLQRVIGFSKAMQMFLTGERFEGQKAFDFGLLNYFVESENEGDNENENKDSLEIKGSEIAEKIAGNAPVAQMMTKKAMKVSYLNDLGTSLDLLSSFQGITQRTSDHFEALQAFKEKRNPNFKGS
jgi:enoyl-CoA hydratase/carnithine racemase